MRGRARSWAVPIVSVALAALPVVVATLRALGRGWIPIGDNGLILLRTEDVATSHHPLLGTWTSASQSAGHNLNNPGPLWFDALAPLTKVAGPATGFALAVMVTNVLAIAGAAWAAHRVGGERALVLVSALSAGLAWAMGSELLFDAWQPHGLILPFWAFLILCWALASGRLLAAPFVVALASLLVQTHLGYVYVVTLIVLATVGLVAAWLVSERRAGGNDWRRVAPELRRAVWWSLGTGVVVWLQPLIDQIAGTGNLASLVRSGGGGADRVGLGLGGRIVASVVALPPWWTRPGFSTVVRATGVVDDPRGRTLAEGEIAGSTAAWLGLAAVAVVLAAVVVRGARRTSRPLVAAGALGAGAVAAALASMVLLPISVLGISPHQMRWLWPISAFVLLAALLALADWAPMRGAVVPAALVATGVLSILNLPTRAAPEGPIADRDATATTKALLAQLDGYRPKEAVLFDVSTLRFAEPYSGPVLARLARSGIDLRVSDDVMVRQLGESRRASGEERLRLILLEGPAVGELPPGARQLAFVAGLDRSEATELERLRGEVVAQATRDGLRLNEAGRDARRAGRFDVGDVVLAPGEDAAALEASGFLAALVADRQVELAPESAPLFERYAELQRRDERETVGLFEVPMAP